MPDSIDTRPRGWTVVAIAAAALALRLAAIPLTPPGDAQEFHDIGWNLATGHGFAIVADVPTAYRAPVYPMFLAAIYALVGFRPVIIWIAQALVTTAVCLVVYVLTARVFGERTARLAATVAVLSPPMIVYVNRWALETIDALLVAAAAWVLWIAVDRYRRLRPSAAWFAAAGVVMGIKTLNRPVTLLFPVALALLLVMVDHRAKPAFRAAGIFTGAMVLTLAPWILRNYAVFDRLIPVSADFGGPLLVSNNWAGEASRLPDVEITRANELRAITRDAVSTNDRWFRIALDRMADRPMDYAKAVAARFALFWRGYSSPAAVGTFPIDRGPETPGTIQVIAEKRWGLLAARAVFFVPEYGALALAFAGVWMARRDWRNWAPVALLIVYYWVAYAAIHVTPRYKIPVVPLTAMFTGVALVRVLDATAPGLRRWRRN